MFQAEDRHSRRSSDEDLNRKGRVSGRYDEYTNKVKAEVSLPFPLLGMRKFSDNLAYLKLNF